MKYLAALGILAFSNIAAAQSVQLQTAAFTFVSPATAQSADFPEQLAEEHAGVAVIDLNPAALGATAYTTACTDYACAWAPQQSGAHNAGFNNTYSLTVSEGYRVTGYSISATLTSATYGDVFTTAPAPPVATTAALLTSTVKSADGLVTYATGSDSAAHSLDGGQSRTMGTSKDFSATGQFSIALDLQLQTYASAAFYEVRNWVCYDEWQCHWDIRYEFGSTWADVSLSDVKLTVYSEQLSAVPEPQAIYLLLAGLIVTGAAVRSGRLRRRNVPR